MKTKPALPTAYRPLLGRYLRPQRRRVLLLGALLLGRTGLDLFNPLLLRAFIDTAGAGAALAGLLGLAGAFLGVALLTQGISVGETYVAENIGQTATNQLRADLTLHCLQLDPTFHQVHTPGELIERVDGDVATLGKFFSRLVIDLFGNGLLLLGALGLLWSIDWRVGATLTVFAILALLLLNSLRERAVPFWGAARQASAELFGFLEERLAGTEDIRANGATAYARRQLAERSRALLRKQRLAGMVGSATGGVGILLFTVGTAIALGLGAYLYQAHALTLGTVYLIFSYTDLIRRPIEGITRQLQDLQQATAGIGRIGALLAVRSAIADGPGAPLPPGAPAVEFDAVHFAYAAEAPVLQGLSFALAPGRVLGVLGRTGSGKTTIARLLFRLYDLGAGSIRLGGVDLRALRLADLRRHVGMVTQEIHLFHASVRDNLTFFDHSVPDARIREVIGDLGLSEWFAGLPAGLDTKLAPGGSGLSAGQAQLLAFARVFLQDPGLVILDEASSRLDPATERQVERAVDKLLAGRTGIVIAHRLATVARADEILVLDEGRPAEYGARLALAGDLESQFARLLRTGLEEVLR